MTGFEMCRWICSIQYICKGSLQMHGIDKLLWAARWCQDETARITVLGRMAISLPLVLATEKKSGNNETTELAETGRTGSASVILSVAMWLFYGFGQLIRHSSNVNLFAIIETFDLYIGGPVDLASCVHVILLYTLQARLQRYPHSWIFMVIPDHSSPSDFFGVSTPKDLRLCRLILFGVLFGCAADAVVMVSPVGASQW